MSLEYDGTIHVLIYNGQFQELKHRKRMPHGSFINMKIFLIGKNGQLGFFLEKTLRNNKFQVFSYGREDLDIENFEKIKSEIESRSPDVVINATAYHLVEQCEENPEKAFIVNAVAVRNLAKICKERKIIFVTYSTDYVFDGLLGHAYDENNEPNPLQVYGVSKLSGEFLTRNYCDKSFVIRTCGVYGGKLGSRSKKGNFILNIMKQAQGKKTLKISSEQIVSPTYAPDLAIGTLELLKKMPPFGVYHLVNDGTCSWAEFATEAFRKAHIKTKIIPIDRKGMVESVRKPLFSALKNKKAAKIGIVLPHWKDALARYIKYLSV
ncbi:MAG: dTDP-4-dehydrorhamnose reductase [Candidatus Levybacteria bacterium CG_4_10_14_0_2_um_filter_36_16]|nr:MAG: dTDP-4-dehydrorhamnose reductase [Candidatus Levybacteria bacterium CG10_big_fil_rev_8_21_14_0_10_36_30]PIZ98047.1 MAG: dTDP-4-dehydrorhamnose reductase [Candidatus Levybacteria bacterium CG_4_10_14_0_2_um_filter_36_16]